MLKDLCIHSEIQDIVFATFTPECYYNNIPLESLTLWFPQCQKCKYFYWNDLVARQDLSQCVTGIYNPVEIVGSSCNVTRFNRASLVAAGNYKPCVYGQIHKMFLLLLREQSGE